MARGQAEPRERKPDPPAPVRAPWLAVRPHPAPQARATAARAPLCPRPPGAGTASDPSSIHSENGFGSSSQVPGVSPAAAGIGAGVAAAHTAGSTLPGYLLIVLIALAAIAVGLLASRTRGEPK